MGSEKFAVYDRVNGDLFMPLLKSNPPSWECAGVHLMTITIFNECWKRLAEVENIVEATSLAPSKFKK